MSRYKGASENAEKIEDELKVEKRKLQREVRAPPCFWDMTFPALCFLVSWACILFSLFSM